MMEQHVRLVDAAVDVLIDALLNPCGPICIGICGCSGSGKSTLAANLQELMSEGGIRAAVVTQDSYYKTDEDLTPAEQSLKAASALNWDQPAMIKWPLLQAGIDSMRDGGELTVPVSGHPRGVKERTTYRADGVDVLILEGLFVCSPEAGICERLRKKLFVQCDSETALQRRIARRVFPEQTVRKQWSTYVQPGFEKYILPHAGMADLTVPNTESAAIERLMDGVRTHAKWSACLEQRGRDMGRERAG